jgi:hypothetical protein
MDDATKTMVLTLVTGIVKKGAIVAGTTLATHGWISGNQTETIVSLAVAGVPFAISLWQDYGKAIVLSQLAVLKAKSLASAEKIKDAGLPPVTASDIAAQSATLTPDQVTKTVATLPPSIQDTVAK